MESILFLISGCKDIYDKIGPGYPECVYHKALEVWLRIQKIEYESEVITPLMYMNHNIGHTRCDIIISKSFLVELKAISNFSQEVGIVQLKNYMKYHSISSGLIVNFGQPNKISDGDLSFRLIKNENHIFEISDYKQIGPGQDFSFVKRPMNTTLNLIG